MSLIIFVIFLILVFLTIALLPVISPKLFIKIWRIKKITETEYNYSPIFYAQYSFKYFSWLYGWKKDNYYNSKSKKFQYKFDSEADTRRHIQLIINKELKDKKNKEITEIIKL